MKWYLYALLLLILVLLWLLFDARRKIELAGVVSNVFVNEATDIVSGAHRRVASSDSLLRLSELARAELAGSYAREQKSWGNERKGYQRQLKAVDTKTATVPQLDSTHLAMYGPAETDTTHTISLDYSRKLTGDALRLPIEQRYRLRAEDQLDSAEGHYTRIIGSYTIDLEMLQQDKKENLQAIDGLAEIVTDQQEAMRAQEKAFRRQRLKERVVEGLIIVAIIVVAL